MDARYGVPKKEPIVWIMLFLFLFSIIGAGAVVYVQHNINKQCEKLGFEGGTFEQQAFCLTGERVWDPLNRKWHEVNCPLELAKQNKCEEILNDQTSLLQNKKQ